MQRRFQGTMTRAGLMAAAAAAAAALGLLTAGCGGGSGGLGAAAQGRIRGTVTVVAEAGAAGPGSGPAADYRVEVHGLDVVNGEPLRAEGRTNDRGEFLISVPAGRYSVRPSDDILATAPAFLSVQEVTVLPGQTTTSVPLSISLSAP